MGLWLYVSGDTPVRWTRPAAPDGLVLRLRPGLNLVGVVSDGAVDLSDAAASDAWRWDPSRQQYEPYRFGDATLTGGDALWIEASAPINWWQPGTGDPPFVFLGDIPTRTRQAILAEYENMRRFFAEHFAVATRGSLHYVGADVEAVRAVYSSIFGNEPPQGFCERSSPDDIHVLRLHCSGPEAFVYRYVNALLRETPVRGLGGVWSRATDPHSPDWLIEGAHRYLWLPYLDAEGELPGRRRDGVDASARWLTLPLSYFEVTESHNAVTDEYMRALGFFAVEWLAERAGDPAVFDYLGLMRASGDWRAAFASAFGIGVDDFYEEFEAYRAEAFPPLPHLTDDLDEPVLVFVGDVPALTAAEIHSEFENVRQFFADRFEVEATEFTLYVARNVESAAPTLPGVGYIYCLGPPESGRAIMTLDRCHSPFALDYIYIGAIVRELAPRETLGVGGSTVFSSASRAPVWVPRGLVEYAAAAYRAAAGRLDIAEYRAREVNVARVTRESLRDQASYSGPTPSLSYLAVEWLANHAGEPAVFEYYRVLPSATSAAAAFESAFGLTLNDFYEQFEAYRETLR